MSRDDRHLPLSDFFRLTWRQKTLVITAYLSLWAAFDVLGFLFSSQRMMCSWYPNTGIGTGFAVYFGWPMIFLEMIGRLVMSVFLWDVDFSPASVFSYRIFPSIMTLVLSTPLRRAIRFKGRVDSPHVAAVFTFLVFIGTAFKSFIVQAVNWQAGVLNATGFLNSFSVWWAGDLIGFVTLTPVMIVLICPWILGQKMSLFPLRKTKTAGAVVMALTILFLFLLGSVPERHFVFWHLVIGAHVVGAWFLGTRWMTLQVAFTNIGLSLVELLHPSNVYPLEQQGFLAVVTGGGLYLAILFDEREEHLRNLDKMTQDLTSVSERETQFLNVISHEFRNPLNVILGYGSTLDAGTSPEGLAKIKGQAKTLESMVQRLAVLGSPQSLWQQSVLTPIDVRDIVHDVVKKWTEVAHKKGLFVDWTFPEEPLAITTMPESLRLALDEVLSNAVKFTAKGVVRVQAKWSPKKSLLPLRNEAIVQIRVEDSGIGVGPEFSLFKTFQQEVMGLNREHGGLGIGGSVCRSLLEGIEGRLYLEWSERGRGSCFVIELEDLEKRLK